MTPRTILAALSAAALAVTLSACGGTGSAGSGSGETVTVYSADGLATWYKPQFDAFTKSTGVNVNLVEAGSGEVVSRVEKEQSNPQADVLVTLPPFIQKADQSGLLQPSGVDTAGIAPPGGARAATTSRSSTTRSASSRTPGPIHAGDLGRPADPKYKGKLQYSTPGQAGDGTAVLSCCST